MGVYSISQGFGKRVLNTYKSCKVLGFHDCGAEGVEGFEGPGAESGLIRILGFRALGFKVQEFGSRVEWCQLGV